jgi:HSP20 family protein
MSLNRWDPFSEMMSLREAMNRLMEDVFISPRRLMGRARSLAGRYTVPMDVEETPDELVVRAALPGVSPDQVSVTCEQGTLTIRGTIASPAQPAGPEARPAEAAGGGGAREGGRSQHRLREIYRGEFVRAIRLPAAFDPDKAEATFENGLLTLRLPRREAAKPHQIPIRTAAPAAE